MGNCYPLLWENRKSLILNLVVMKHNAVMHLDSTVCCDTCTAGCSNFNYIKLFHFTGSHCAKKSPCFGSSLSHSFTSLLNSNEYKSGFLLNGEHSLWTVLMTPNRARFWKLLEVHAFCCRSSPGNFSFPDSDKSECRTSDPLNWFSSPIVVLENCSNSFCALWSSIWHGI